MRISTLFISSLLLLGTLNAQAQDRDKVSADQMLYEELCANHTTENYHVPFHVDAKKLEMTDESGILPGEIHHIGCLCQEVAENLYTSFRREVSCRVIQ